MKRYRALQKPQKDASEMCLQGLVHLNKDGESSSNSDDVCFVSSWNESILIEDEGSQALENAPESCVTFPSHLKSEGKRSSTSDDARFVCCLGESILIEDDESSTLHQCDAQPAYSLEEKTLAKKSDETSDEMDCHLGHSDSHVSPISEISKALENASESCATFSSHPKSEEYFSNSDVDCFVSSLSDSIAVETKEICKSKKEALCIQSRKIPLLQDLKQHQTPYPTQCRCFNFHLAHEPCTPETHMRKERLMKVYYTRVQRKRNASVVCYTPDELVPPGKRSKIEDVAFPVKIRADPSFCYQSSEYLVTDDSTYSVEDKEQDQEASSCQAVLSAAEENLQARASTPEWPVTPERGFKCMACCQVFSSLGDLVDHVKHGVKGDFSCQVFHLAFTWLESKRHMMEKRNKRKKSTRKTSGYKEK
nr:protein FAM170A isoform X6 [Oryctolagus cuniculus]